MMKYVYWVIGYLIIGVITAITEDHRSRKADRQKAAWEKVGPNTNGALGFIGLTWPFFWMGWIASVLARGYGWVIRKINQLVGSEQLQGLKKRLANTLKSE